MNPRLKAFLGGALKISVAVAIIGWLVSTGRLDLKSALSLFQSPTLFLLGFFLVGVNLFMVSERWRWLATSQSVNAGPWSVFKLTLIGTFFNYAMPGGVGGDLVKAYYFGKEHPHARAAAITSVVLDRALGLYGMVIMALVSIILDWNHVQTLPLLSKLFLPLVLLWFGFSFGFYAIFSRKMRQRGWIESGLKRLPLSEKFLKLYETTFRFGQLRSRIIGILAFSMASQALSILFLWVAGEAAGFHVPITTYFLVAPLGYMAMAIPIAPAGIGVGQAAFYVLFNLYLGTKTDIGPVVITSQQVMTALFGLIGAFFYVRRKEPAPTAENLPEEA